MADPEQVRLLKSSVSEWNHWRSTNPFSDVNINGASFHRAVLDNANLRSITLKDTDFSEASLREADLYGSSLVGAHLGHAELYKVDLTRAFLARSVLVESDLQQALLRNTDLTEADASRADFRGADLSEAKALGTNFFEARLTGACLCDWHINSSTRLEGAQADYIYLASKYGEFSDRRPHSGNFKPGEFAALFQQALDTLDLIFVDGIDWQTFFASFQELRQQYSDAELNIQAIEKKSGGSFVVKLEVNEKADKATLQQSWDGIYEENQQLKAQLWKTEGKLEGYKEQLSDFQQRVLQGMADQNQTTINNDFSGALISGNVANSLSGSAQQVYNEAPDKSLAEAAQEIQALLEQLSQTYPCNTLVEKAQLATVAAEQAQANPALRQRLLSAIKAGSLGAIDQAVSHPAVTFFFEAVKAWKAT